MPNIFKYPVNLVPLDIENKEPSAFRDELYDIPYLLYEVERVSNGDVIAINKPGGKGILVDYPEMILWCLSIIRRIAVYG